MSNLAFSVVIFLVYAKLFGLGRYPVTVGGLFAVWFVIRTLIVNHGRYRYRWQLVLMLVYPVAVYTMHFAFNTIFAVSFSRFILSYALWLASLIVIWCGFQPTSAFKDVNPSKVLIVLLLLGAIQYIGLSFFGKTFGYDIVQPISINSFHSGYMKIDGADEVRAVGSYYEPSFFGRVVSTLSMMIFVKDRKVWKLLMFSGLGFFFSRSFVIVVFTVLILGFFVVLQKRRIGAFAIFVVLTSILITPVLKQRLEQGSDRLSGNSTMIRIALPIYVLYKVLPQFPFGVPIGANETIVKQTTWQIAEFTEPKITNGFYEVILYFGVCMIFPLFAIGWAITRSSWRKDIPMSIAFLYLIAATAASGSYLGIESSLLIAIFTISMRRASSDQAWSVEDCELSAVVV